MGVAGIVKFVAAPARCPDAEIAKLIARADADGIVRLPTRPPPQPAPRILAPRAGVVIADGPFRGLDAIYARMPAHDRESLCSSTCSAAKPRASVSGRSPSSSLRAAHTHHSAFRTTFTELKVSSQFITETWLEERCLNKLDAMRKPGESYSDLVLRLVELGGALLVFVNHDGAWSRARERGCHAAPLQGDELW